MNRYKNKALNLDEMRRRREEEGIQLRKQKREQQVIDYYRFFQLVVAALVPSYMFFSLIDYPVAS